MSEFRFQDDKRTALARDRAVTNAAKAAERRWSDARAAPPTLRPMPWDDAETGTGTGDRDMVDVSSYRDGPWATEDTTETTGEAS